MSHFWLLGQVKDQDMLVNNITTVQNCDNNMDRSGGSYDLVSFKSEYKNQLLSVVLNNLNKIHILLYDFMSISLSSLSVILSNIDNSIFQFLKFLAQINDVLCHTHSVVNSSTDIICNFRCVLKNNISNLKDLHPKLLSLSDNLGYVIYLKNQLQTIIDCKKYTNSLNSKLSEIVKKIISSLSEFQEIEPLLNSIKSIIYEIKNRKDQLIASTSAIPPEHLNQVYFKIKYCCDKIDRIFGAIEDFEFYTLCLKYWICKFIKLDIRNNLLNRLLFFDKILETDIDEICSPFNWLYCCICKICNICDSDPKCTCECKCATESTGSFICLCLCNSTQPSPKNGCCICICKKDKDNCKCVCICICNKDCGTVHSCEKCLVKVDIGTLKDQTYRILCSLRWIRWYIYGFKKKCCYCSCCLNGRCGTSCCDPCKSIMYYYKPTISNINSIEFLFKDIGTKIPQLTKLYKFLSSTSVIAKRCEPCVSCNCKEKMDILIKHIDRSLHYYYLFGSRLDDIRSFVEYKMNYYRSKQIFCSLEKSVKPLLNKLGEINSQIVLNSDYTGILNDLLMINYSGYSIFQSYVIINRLVQCSKKIDQILLVTINIHKCKCISRLETRNEIDLGIVKAFNIINKMASNGKGGINDSLKLNQIKKLIQNDIKDNHQCLCMVTKYILYPAIVKISYGILGIDFDTLSTISRKFQKYNDLMTYKVQITQFLIIMINLFDLISQWIIKNYPYAWVGYMMRVDIKCFCMYSNDHGYYSVVSIILFLSSLIENIWSMDTETVRTAIDRLSLLYSQLEIYDFNSTSLKPVCCNPVYSLLVNKECKPEAPNKSCCWCVTCYNLLMVCISLCLQFKLCNALCSKNKQVCKKIEEFCNVDKCECNCAGKQNGICCLLKLALDSKLPCGSQELEKVLGECKDENGCCAQLLKKVKGGNYKLLLLGCECKCTDGTGDLKVKCVFFNNLDGSTRVAVVVYCKCPETSKPCCLTELIDKLKQKLADKLCKDENCVCDDLKNVCKEICGADCAEQCVCTKLKDHLPKICKGNGKCGADGCLCKQIEKLKECFTKKDCTCKNKGYCKVLGASVRVLSKACKSNVLEPYKRITLDLLPSSKDKTQLIRSILDRINQGTVNRIYLVKNNLTIHGTSSNNISNVTSVRNWGYDILYEQDLSPSISLGDV